MRGVFRIVLRFIEAITGVSGWIAALCLVVSAMVVTEAVVARKLFGVSTIWQTETSIFMLIFVVFVGAGFVQKNEKHLNVDLVIIHLPVKVREITVIVVSITSCMLSGIIAFFSWPMWWEAVIRNEHSESLWGPPLWIPYLFLPLGMSILFLQYVSYIHKKIVRLKKGEVGGIKRIEIKDIEIKRGGRGE